MKKERKKVAVLPTISVKINNFLKRNQLGDDNGNASKITKINER